MMHKVRGLAVILAAMLTTLLAGVPAAHAATPGATMDISFRPIGTVTADGQSVTLTIDYTCTLPEGVGTFWGSEVVIWLAQPAKPNFQLADNQAGGDFQGWWELTCDGTPHTSSAIFTVTRGAFHPGKAVAYRFFSSSDWFSSDPVYVTLRWAR